MKHLKHSKIDLVTSLLSCRLTIRTYGLSPRHVWQRMGKSWKTVKNNRAV